jgi:S1-C subfamily serine protease
MRSKHLLAALAVVVAAATGAACAGFTGNRADGGAAGQHTTNATATATTTSRPGGDHTVKRPKPRPAPEKLSQPDLIAKVKPSVVRLVGSSGGGSGVVIDAADGLVLTNAHVTFGQQGLRARVGDDPASETAAQLVAAAPCDDLAVVRLVNKPANLRAIRIGDSSRVRLGDHVTVLGYPTSLQLQEQRAGNTTQAQQLVANEGSVSAVNVTTGGDPSFPVYVSTIQHQAPTTYGNSGGPLVDDRGRLVGINSLINTQAHGQAYAISANRVLQLLPELVAGNSQANLGWDLVSLDRADLPKIFAKDSGLAAQGGATLGQQVVQQLADQQIEGLYVRATERGSPVQAARIFRGNLVTSIDGQPVSGEQDVCDLVLSKRPGETVQVAGYWLYTAEAAKALQPWQVEVEVW